MIEHNPDLDSTAIFPTTYRQMLRQALREDTRLPKLALDMLEEVKGLTNRRVVIHVTYTAEIHPQLVLREAEAIGMLPPALAEKWRAK